MASILGFESVTLLSGVGFILSSITGGGMTIKIKDKELNLPKLGLFSKIICGVFGFLLIFIPITAIFFGVNLQAVASKSTVSDIEITEEFFEEDIEEEIKEYPSSSLCLAAPLYAIEKKIKVQKQNFRLVESEKVKAAIISKTAKIYSELIPDVGTPIIHIVDIDNNISVPLKIYELKRGYDVELTELNRILIELELTPIYRIRIEKTISMMSKTNSVEINIFKKLEDN